MCLSVPGRLIEIIPHDEEIMRTGKVSFDGIIKDVSLAMVPEAKVDDYVLVHVGAAISIIDQEEAARTFDLLKQMGELDELDPKSS